MISFLRGERLWTKSPNPTHGSGRVLVRVGSGLLLTEAFKLRYTATARPIAIIPIKRYE
ncbi:MAG TPA: hypothetical protein VGQ39_24930 [Pyrinomonadaceae bacterium]|nr:hypothetical protein [Pyrinomonadaceae bacterium]